MPVSFCSAFILLSTVTISSTQSLDEPPSIIQGNTQKVFYDTGYPPPIKISCSATGKPTPSFQWLRNGVKIENEVSKDLTGVTAEGNYQCHATNKLGTAVSDIATVVKADRAVFPYRTYDFIYNATYGDKLTLICHYFKAGTPAPRRENFGWKSGDEEMRPNQRFQIDDEGNLHFAALTEPDFVGSRECHIKNEVLNLTPAGSKSRINFDQGPPVQRTAPAIMFYSNMTLNPGGTSSVITVVEGSPVTMRCFFSGSSDIVIEWKREDKTKLKFDDIEYDSVKSQLKIKKVSKRDEAMYICTGTNDIATTEFRIRLHVYAAPVFNAINDQPHNVNKTVGENAVFHCKSYANPPATVTWFQNGIPIDPVRAERDPRLAKFNWTEDRQTLTIAKLCKNDCPAEMYADVVVIQCNASNQFGYAFSNGYINVFERTELKIRPPLKVEVTALHTAFNLSALAVSDISTPVSYEWSKNDRLLWDDGSRVRITLGADGKTFLEIVDVQEGDYGRYRCNATNGISYDYAEIDVTGPSVPIPQASMWPVLVAGLLVLLVLIVIAILCFAYQNRGEDYQIDETERKLGNNPEQDLEDNGFHPFQRKETGCDGDSTISRSSMERLNQRVDEETELIKERSGNSNSNSTLNRR